MLFVSLLFRLTGVPSFVDAACPTLPPTQRRTPRDSEMDSISNNEFPSSDMSADGNGSRSESFNADTMNPSRYVRFAWFAAGRNRVCQDLPRIRQMIEAQVLLRLPLTPLSLDIALSYFVDVAHGRVTSTVECD